MSPHFNTGSLFEKASITSDRESPVSPMTMDSQRREETENNDTSASNPTGPPSRSAAAPSRKTRVALACKRCKRRKQRCDGAHPVCTSCDRVSAPCIYERTIRPQYPGGKSLYINALEERIAFLEARLPAYAEDHFAKSAGGQHAEAHENGTTRYRSRIDSSSSHRDSISQSEDVEGEERESIVDGVAYLSLCASGTAEPSSEPFYLGSSSGATIARMIHKSIFRISGNRVVHKGAARPRQSGVDAERLTAHNLTQPSLEGSFEFPFLDQARLLFDVFFDRMHTRWPILDRKAYSALFEKQYDQGALSITQRSIMHLIYAIAARFLQLTRKPSGVDPEQHLLAAIEPMDYIIEQHNLATVQFLILLAVHGQRSAYGAGAWSQVRYAVSLCIELGLHRVRNAPPSAPDARDLEIRRRAFWACYSMDRATSMVLGRAFAIADRDINVSFWDLTHKDAPPETSQGTPWCNIEPFIHIVKLERIQSRIQKTFFRVDKDVLSGSPDQRARLDQKMANIRAELDMWIQTVPQSPKDSKKITWLYDPESASQDAQDYYNLQYHKGLLMLLTVLLPTLPPTDARFVTVARSAACVCIAYKRLNQQKTLTYTMISLHSCFVAGLTLMYCLWRDRSLFSYDVFEATQACSQSLTIFGEKWAGAVKYRDIFDALSGSLFKTLVNPSGSSDSTGLGVEDESMRRPLKVKFDAGLASQPSASPQGMRDAQEPTMCHLVSDAVKEAFMEVDEEAPGGWQGWRMWNEMLGEGSNGASAATSGHYGGPTRDTQSGGWSATSLGTHGYSNGMLDNDQYDPMTAGDWDFGGVEGLD